MTVLILIIDCGHRVGATRRSRSGFAVNVGVGVSQVKDRDGTESFNANAFGFILGGEYRFNDHFRAGTEHLRSRYVPRTSSIPSIRRSTFSGIDLVMRFIMPVSDERSNCLSLAGSAGYTADLEPGGNNGLFGEDAVEFGLGSRCRQQR